MPAWRTNVGDHAPCQEQVLGDSHHTRVHGSNPRREGSDGDLATAQVLAAVIPRIASTTGDEQAEAVAVTTMLMEVVTVLHTPEVALNPAQPPEQRALEECPPPQEVRATGVFRLH